MSRAEVISTMKLEDIPELDGCTFELMTTCSSDGKTLDGWIKKVDPAGEESVIAFIDGETLHAYAVDDGEAESLRFDASGHEPLVKLVGTLGDATGQVVIKQPEGHWRRYSRWDKLAEGPATKPDAVVRTLPQCGCGGYLGAPMMFDSFMEMMAYFFVVFSDAQAVNEKHAAILNGGSCGADVCDI